MPNPSNGDQTSGENPGDGLDDVDRGMEFHQGVAHWGAGILIDGAGRDRHVGRAYRDRPDDQDGRGVQPRRRDLGHPARCSRLRLRG